jgi:hypothetical protein
MVGRVVKVRIPGPDDVRIPRLRLFRLVEDPVTYD